MNDIGCSESTEVLETARGSLSLYGELFDVTLFITRIWVLPFASIITRIWVLPFSSGVRSPIWSICRLSMDCRMRK